MEIKHKLAKACFFKKVYPKICLGFLLGKECPDSKKSDVLKTAEFGNFKTANYIEIGRYLEILWRFLQKNVVSNVVSKTTSFYLQELLQNHQKLSRLGYS